MFMLFMGVYVVNVEGCLPSFLSCTVSVFYSSHKYFFNIYEKAAIFLCKLAVLVIGIVLWVLHMHGLSIVEVSDYIHTEDLNPKSPTVVRGQL